MEMVESSHQECFGVDFGSLNIFTVVTVLSYYSEGYLCISNHITPQSTKNPNPQPWTEGSDFSLLTAPNKEALILLVFSQNPYIISPIFRVEINLRCGVSDLSFNCSVFVSKT